MREFVIIAGPQAAGKTTVITCLSEQYRNIVPLFSRTKSRIPALFPLQETRQIIVHKNIILGAVFMTPEQEKEVIKCDLDRMDLILDREEGNLVYLDECNIFTLAYAKAKGIDLNEIDDYWNKYMERLKLLDAKVIFLYVDSGVSWERRKERYHQRLVYFPRKDHEIVMRRYREYIEKINPLLLDIYKNLPLPKKMIDATLPVKTVIQSVSESLAEMSKVFNSLSRN